MKGEIQQPDPGIRPAGDPIGGALAHGPGQGIQIGDGDRGSVQIEDPANGAHPIYLQLAEAIGIAPPEGAWPTYGIAGIHLIADLDLHYLAPFRRPNSPPPRLFLGRGDPSRRAPLAVTSAKGWLAGAERAVTRRVLVQGETLEIEGLGCFELGHSGDLIRCVQLAAPRSRPMLEEAAIGAPLALALAHRGIWCLHASALQREGRAVLLLGASGRGKSTLAAYCNGRRGFRRLADDILPCRLNGHSLIALPAFPQLKLPHEVQRQQASPEALPVAAIAFLDAGPDDRPAEVLRPSKIGSVRQLADHTVAAALFDPELHRRHLDLAAGLLNATPILQLRYPHDYSRLPEVCRLLAEGLDHLGQHPYPPNLPRAEGPPEVSAGTPGPLETEGRT